MSNPITDLWHVAVSGWDRLTRAYGNTWRDMYDVLDFYKWKAEVQLAFQEIAQALQSVAVLNATSAADTVAIGRDTAVSTRQAVNFLRFTYIPASSSRAYHQAARYALALYFRLDQVLTRRIAAEHAAMLRRVLEEELGREIADAKEHADMVTRVAIEANDRTLADLRLDSVLTQRIAAAKAQVLAIVDQVRAQLAAQIAQVLKYAQSIPGLVDQEASRGYDSTLAGHATGIQRLLDTAVAHEPLIAGLVSRLAGWLVDLAEVDDPLIRLAAQFVLRELIDRLGVDTALGALLRDVLGPALSGGKPKTLQDVAAAAGNRLNGAEAGLAQLSPLAPEADALHELGTVAFDAALLGYLALGVADPKGWADDTAAALEPVTVPLLGAVRGLLGA
jgi:hypothetical protein